METENLAQEQLCDRCQKKDTDKLQYELNECKKLHKIKDQQIKKMDKKLFILMCVVVGIGAIFGKEALDSIVSWLETLNSVKSQVDNLTASIVPGPAVLAVLGVGMPFAVRPRRR
ncbi:MAG: hypothetical protein Unbinned1446contig1001_13 [Prokaryotic dsDNA virus sp.]|nr:MAG: hypothetical protein Unbinned1446contig1001_13 [Prokaryotic dsDNA virus sp.]|tara:strand:- start:13620 stop:13964 length:345 start_codon:yes stop_codon:yes gene_type:complete